MRASALRTIGLMIVVTACVACTSGESAITIVTPSTSTATGGAGAFQLRPVETIAAPGTDAFDRHVPTCGPEPQPSCTDDLLLDPAGVTLEGADGTRFVLGRLLADGSNISSASAIAVSPRDWVVRVMLDADGTAAFESATSAAMVAPPPENQIAIVADGVVISAPTVQAPIASGQVIVSSDFTQREAEDVAASLTGP